MLGFYRHIRIYVHINHNDMPHDASRRSCGDATTERPGGRSGEGGGGDMTPYNGTES